MNQELLQRAEARDGSSAGTPDDLDGLTVDDAVTLTGPDGTDYWLSIPETATEAEIAAIAATVSAHVADGATGGGAASDEASPDDGRSADPWRVAARRASTGRRTRPTGDGTWKLAGRSGFA